MWHELLGSEKEPSGSEDGLYTMKNLLDGSVCISVCVCVVFNLSSLIGQVGISGD